MPRMTKDEIDAHLGEHFAEARSFAAIDAIRSDAARGDQIDVRMPLRVASLRPGGTIAGPALMALADTAVYYLLLAADSRFAPAVTSSLEMKFLSRPRPADVVATATLLKLGKRLAVAAVELRCDGSPDLVAYATVTYAVPNT